jgi:hypothetical protein
MTFDLNDTTFVCIDISPRERDRVWTWENRLPAWVESNFTPEELNAAEAHFHDTMPPNALKTVEFARERGLYRRQIARAESQLAMKTQ